MKRSLIACVACVGALSAGVGTAMADDVKPDAPPAADDAKLVANQKCRAEQEADPVGFETKYGKVKEKPKPEKEKKGKPKPEKEKEKPKPEKEKPEKGADSDAFTNCVLVHLG